MDLKGVWCVKQVVLSQREVACSLSLSILFSENVENPRLIVSFDSSKQARLMKNCHFKRWFFFGQSLNEYANRRLHVLTS